MFDYMRTCFDRLAALSQFHFTTLPEWDMEGSRSDCHGWSATPLYEMPSTLLGVRPFEDGWAKILVKPCPMGYTDCRGKVITPKGMVYVSWKIQDGEMQLELDTPHDTIVAMPDSRRYRVQAGHHVMTATLECVFSIPMNE